MGRDGPPIMSEAMLFSAPVILIGSAVFVVVFLLLVLLRVRQGLAQQIDHQRQQARSLDKELQKANRQLLEIRSVAIGLGQKVTDQQDLIQHLNERITELEHVDTDGRLYSRATKMVQLGADINELIKECELPKAEAELMMSLQKKIAGHESIPPLSSHPEGRDPVQSTRRPAKK
ncbi:DNA repair protein [Vibrio ordalii FF-167]|nr:DNA repair protein [Vibrio ordalii FF-167]